MTRWCVLGEGEVGKKKSAEPPIEGSTHTFTIVLAGYVKAKSDCEIQVHSPEIPEVHTDSVEHTAERYREKSLLSMVIKVDPSDFRH